MVLSTDRDGDPYCHFQYQVAFSGCETGRSAAQQSPGVQPWHVRSRVFYFDNGQFAVQPARGLSETWFPSFLTLLTDTPVGDEFRIYGTERKSSDTPPTHGVSQSSDSSERVPASDGTASLVSSAASDNRSPPQGGDPADLLAEATRTGSVGAHGTLSGVPLSSGCAPDTVVATWDETDWSDNVDKAKRATEIYRQIAPYLQNHV
ncbi:hypothetical protein [Halocatena pleomorpha]|uniref:Uncharacterized protein n=1 Tax=Halocatena pleomorpha TaxID=1785090 RepID=A0A3P3RF52_9EURY|nr:hypothetical protein [Halocatena pleomorpha]RRJ31984.1 hypothetical protein EIK79_05495 [Halocatena pleomorpha]